MLLSVLVLFFFFFQAEDGIRDHCVTGVQTCALPISIRAQQDSVARMINRLEWMRKQLQDLAGQLRTDSAMAGDASAKRLAVLADSLEHRVAGVEGVLFDVHLTGAREDAFRNPMQIYGRLAALQSDVADNGADFPPTAQQLAVHDVFAQRINAASARFADLVEKVVPAFVAELRKTTLRDVIATGIDGAAPARTGP